MVYLRLPAMSIAITTVVVVVVVVMPSIIHGMGMSDEITIVISLCLLSERILF